MDGQTLREGTDYSVTFFAGDNLLCGLVIRKLDSHSLDVSLFRDNGAQIETALDILEACWTVVASQSRLSRMERLVSDADLALVGDEGEEVSESDTPTDIDDFPF